MKVITCASYIATGSSAVTDFFSEFDNCYCKGDFEFRFIFDPNGIRDLEYKLIEMNDRHNSGYAIKNYLKYAKYLNGDLFIKGYKHYMGDAFMKYTKEYVNNITELKTECWWLYDTIDKGKLFHYLNGGFRKLTHLFTKTYGTNLLKLFHSQSYYSAIDKETFYKYTKDYINKILVSLNENNSEYFMIDQLLPASNIDSYLNYFDDIKVIVSERDPRDVYLFEKVEFRSGIIPASNVHDFCEWFRIIRKHRKREIYDTSKVLLVHFEDWIYNYEETSKKVMEFVGINPENHIAPKTYLNPEISIKNTNLKVKYTRYNDDIKYIEEHLAEYLYDFPV